MIKCVICGKEFMPGNRPDGVPNGLGLMAKDGKTIINVCSECVEKTTEDPSITERLQKLMEGGQNE